MTEKHRSKNFFKDMKIKAQKIKEAMAKYPNATSEMFQNLSNKTQQAVADKVAQTVIKAAGIKDNSMNPENLRKYCNVVSDQIAMAQKDTTCRGMNTIRQNIIHNLPLDLHDDLAKGMTVQEVHDFFWNEPKWQLIWFKLGWDEDTLNSMINTEYVSLHKDK